MATSSRSSRSASAAMAMNSGPRWLISMTHMPEPCQSSISAAAWRSTSSGNTAGPALKLNTLAIGPLPGLGTGILAVAAMAIRAVAVVPVAAIAAILDLGLGHRLDGGELRAGIEIDQRDALGGAAHFAHLRHRRAD